MNSEKQSSHQTPKAHRALRFPANMPLSVRGIIRRYDAGFVLEMNDLDEFQQPTIQAIPIVHHDTELQGSIERHLDRVVTVEGQWLPDPEAVAATGCLQILSLAPENSAATEEH